MDGLSNAVKLVWVELQMEVNNIIIGICHNPPSIETFSSIHLTKKGCGNIVISGDLNYFDCRYYLSTQDNSMGEFMGFN